MRFKHNKLIIDISHTNLWIDLEVRMQWLIKVYTVIYAIEIILQRRRSSLIRTTVGDAVADLGLHC